MNCWSGQPAVSRVTGESQLSEVSILLSALPTPTGVELVEKREVFRRQQGSDAGAMVCWAGQSSRSGVSVESRQSGVSSLLCFGLSSSIGGQVVNGGRGNLSPTERPWKTRQKVLRRASSLRQG